MTKIKDTDYLTISARIRAMENRLLTRERMERMLEARADEEAAKVLTECGYGELPSLTHSGLDEMLSAARGVLYKELKGAVPDKRLVEVFQMKYDYHNAKTLIKAAAVGTEADRLLMEGGRWTATQIKDAFQRDSLRDFTDPFRRAVVQARELLNGGGDPQLADFVLDRAYFEEMRAAAEATGSSFLPGLCAAAHRRHQPALRRPGGPHGQGKRLPQPGAAERRQRGGTHPDVRQGGRPGHGVPGWAAERGRGGRRRPHRPRQRGAHRL